MKNLLLLLFFLVFSLSYSQEIQLIENPKFQGAVFPESYNISYLENPKTDRRFTPTKKEIEEFESQLKKKLKNVNRNRPNQGKGYGPVIHRRLSKYVRQYIGYIDQNGQKVIHANFIWNGYSLWDSIRGWSKPNDQWKSEWQIVFDGGSRYWSINYIIDQKELVDLRVNGVA